MTNGAIIVFVIAIIAVGLFGIYVANHQEDSKNQNIRRGKHVKYRSRRA